MRSALRSMAFAASLLAVACGGGGGSGSSGVFEAENAVIRRVIADQICDSSLGTDYCPADATGVVPGDQSIDTPFDEVSEFECFDDGFGETICDFFFTFDPDGFDAFTSFLVATKSFDSADAWRISAPLDVFSFGAEADGLTTVLVTFEPLGSVDDLLQLAVLVFEGPPEQAAGDTVEVLTDTNADRIFVVPALDPIFVEFRDENEVIDEALETGECSDTGVTFFCPTETSFPASDADPSIGIPDFYLDTTVSTGLIASSIAPCVLSSDRSTCNFELAFSAEGLLSVVHRIGSRIGDGAAERLWTIGPDVFHPCYFTGFCDEDDDACLAEEDACVDDCAPEFTFECVDECVFTCENKPEFGAEYLALVQVEVPDGAVGGPEPRRFPAQIVVLPDSAPGPVNERLELVEEVTGFYAFPTAAFMVELIEPAAGVAGLAAATNPRRESDGAAALKAAIRPRATALR